MKKSVLLIFLGFMLVVSGLNAIDDEEMSLQEKIEMKVRSMRESGVSEALVEKVTQDMIAGSRQIQQKPLNLFFDVQGLEGASNTFYGSGAGERIGSGTFDTFLGANAGAFTVSGNRNNFFGYAAGYYNTTGSQNNFFGQGAGYSNVGGCFNNFQGYAAGYYNTSGQYNCFIGYSAGILNTTGGYNTFIGSNAGYSSTSASRNVFIGNEAGYYTGSGDWNTYVGNYAGNANVSGNYNTCIGHRAGQENTGSENVFIGDYAGHSTTTGSGNVFIGNMAGDWVSAVNNTLVIDNSSTGTPLIYGNFTSDRVGINNSAPGSMFVVGTGGAYCNGTTWVNGSSREYKENIEALTSAEALQTFAKLEPVKFNYKQDKEDPCLGFIAEDVPELVATKDRKGLSPMDMVAVLTKVVQEQQKTLIELQEQIAKMKK